jgi:hypothetical protein
MQRRVLELAMGLRGAMVLALPLVSGCWLLYPEGTFYSGCPAPGETEQSPYVERLIGSIRRECLDHVIVFNEAHLIRILTSYFAYHHEARTHLSLDRNAPIPRQVEPPSHGRIIAIPQVGGLHHRYTRAA